MTSSGAPPLPTFAPGFQPTFAPPAPPSLGAQSFGGDRQELKRMGEDEDLGPSARAPAPEERL